MAVIRTVLGDISPETVGVILPHEHTVFAFFGAYADPRAHYDREAVVHKASEQLRIAKETYRVSAIVDASPLDLGRDIPFQVEVSRRSGVHIIVSTGLFTESLGFPPYWRQRDIDALEDLFITEITEGVAGIGVKCGIIKLASGPGFLSVQSRRAGPESARITACEERAFRAAARVQRKLGVGIITHTEPVDWAVANVGAKQLAILREEQADLSHCVIGHVNTANLVYLVELLRDGVNLAFDTIGLNWGLSDEIIAGIVIALVGMGYQSQLLLSHDSYCMEVRRPPTENDPPAYPSPVDWGYIHRAFIPLLHRGGVDEGAIRQMMIENPRKILAF